MKALLLAAGLGTRLRPITNTTPKCLVPIQGQPLLQYWLDLLIPGGIDEVLINTHYLSESFISYVETSRYRKSIILAYEDILLGTGGTILSNQEFFGDEAFMVVHADNLSRFNINAFLASHSNRQNGVEITMMTFETDRPSDCGIVELDDYGRVEFLHEKVTNPPGTHANAAVYIFEPTVIDFIASLGKPFVDISTEVLPKYLGKIGTFHNDDYHRDIGTPESLALAEVEF